MYLQEGSCSYTWSVHANVVDIGTASYDGQLLQRETNNPRGHKRKTRTKQSKETHPAGTDQSTAAHSSFAQKGL
jgi:hypothetical protein